MAEGGAVKAAASGLGLGYLPVAPGTWASAAAAFAYWGLRHLPTVPCAAAVAGLFLVAMAVGFIVCPPAQAVYGAPDPGVFVLDELAGQWLTCLLFWWPDRSWHAIAALVAFRVFDIAKPFPIRHVERLGGAWGVMFDDLVAALYAAGALWVLRLTVLKGLAS
jgi:phosphatidylglycerophosphatase A